MAKLPIIPEDGAKGKDFGDIIIHNYDTPKVHDTKTTESLPLRSENSKSLVLIGLDDLSEISSEEGTSNNGSPNVSNNLKTPSGALLGGNAESVFLDLEDEKDSPSVNERGSLVRKTTAPRLIAHQMALSVSPEGYMGVLRKPRNSTSSATPSDDSSQYELWATRKMSRDSRFTSNRFYLYLLILILSIIILCIIIIPVVWVKSKYQQI